MADLDAEDWKILRTISHDGRMPYSQIARRTGIKRETVQYRLKRMVSAGVIQHFLPYLDLAKVGYPVWGYMLISFKDLDAAREKQFDDYVRQNQHIIFAYRCLGQYDYGIELFAKTPKHLYSVQQELKRKFSRIIKDVQTGSFIEVTKVNYVPQLD